MHDRHASATRGGSRGPAAPGPRWSTSRSWTPAVSAPHLRRADGGKPLPARHRPAVAAPAPARTSIELSCSPSTRSVLGDVAELADIDLGDTSWPRRPSSGAVAPAASVSCTPPRAGWPLGLPPPPSCGARGTHATRSTSTRSARDVTVLDLRRRRERGAAGDYVPYARGVLPDDARDPALRGGSRSGGTPRAVARGPDPVRRDGTRAAALGRGREAVVGRRGVRRGASGSTPPPRSRRHAQPTARHRGRSRSSPDLSAPRRRRAPLRAEPCVLAGRTRAFLRADPCVLAARPCVLAPKAVRSCAPRCVLARRGVGFLRAEVSVLACRGVSSCGPSGGHSDVVHRPESAGSGCRWWRLACLVCPS